MADEKQIIKKMVAASPNRRSFVRKLGFASAALGAAAAVPKGAMAQSSSTPSSGPSDIDILNFALNLEYLESEFYTVATTGLTIDAPPTGLVITGTGTGGATTGGNIVDFSGSPAVLPIANNLAFDERTHVTLLQGAIASFGGQAVAKPAINLNALGFGFGSVSDFLKLARIFEDIGVTAYGGAAPLIANKTILGYAARILAVEAEHSGNIRLQIAQQGIVTTPVDPADIIPPPSGSLYFSVNSSALTEVRTPGQVLYVAYGGVASATSGGFFPSGVNGNLTVADATPATSDNATLTASPNPATASTGTIDAVVTLTWNAPLATTIEIHVGTPTGPLFTRDGNSGSMTTGAWVTNGMVFYLQDVSNGRALNSDGTLATLTVTVTP